MHIYMYRFIKKGQPANRKVPPPQKKEKNVIGNVSA